MFRKANYDSALGALFNRMNAWPGRPIRSQWCCDSEVWPGCGKRPVGPFKHQGRDVVSVNAFLYREEGVLISYQLCGQCAAAVMKSARRHPQDPSPLHRTIEAHLISAYHQRHGTPNA